MIILIKTQTKTYRLFRGFGSVGNITLTPSMISLGPGLLEHTSVYVVNTFYLSIESKICIFVLTCLLSLSSEWNMVQFIGSSRKYHVSHGVGFTDVFSGYSHFANDNGRNPCISGNDVCCSSFHGARLSRKDVTYGPWKCPCHCYTLRTTTYDKGFTQHVRAMPNL